MSGGLFVAGLAANACVNARAVTPTSTDSDFPASYLQDGFGWTAWRANAAASSIAIEFDCGIVVDEDFESDTKGAAPDSTSEWVILSGTGTVEDDPVTPAEAAFRLGTAASSAYIEKELSPVKTYGVTADIYGGAVDNLNLYVVDIDRHRYWTGSVWSSSKTAFATKLGETYTTYSDEITLEQPDEFAVGPTRLRLLFEKVGTTTVAYIDNVQIWPKVDFGAVLYLVDVPDVVDVECFSKATAAGSYTTRGDLSRTRFRRYGELTAPSSAERYWKMVLDGECFYPPWLAVPILAEKTALPRAPGIRYNVRRIMPQTDSPAHRVNRSKAPRFDFAMEWRQVTATGFRTFADQLVGASRMGAEPVLVVPDTARNEFVYGRGGGLSTFEYQRVTAGVFTHSLAFEDDLLPNISEA